jgi:hypothetical protein
MPLIRGNIVGYDLARMMFHFTMLMPDKRPVACEISSVAMDCIAGVRGTLPIEREDQFLALRDRIEQIASDRFDRNNHKPVRVFAKDVDGHSRQASRSDMAVTNQPNRAEMDRGEKTSVSLPPPFVIPPP